MFLIAKIDRKQMYLLASSLQMSMHKSNLLILTIYSLLKFFKVYA